MLIIHVSYYMEVKLGMPLQLFCATDLNLEG